MRAARPGRSGRCHRPALNMLLERLLHRKRCSMGDALSPWRIKYTVASALASARAERLYSSVDGFMSGTNGPNCSNDCSKREIEYFVLCALDRARYLTCLNGSEPGCHVGATRADRGQVIRSRGIGAHGLWALFTAVFVASLLADAARALNWQPKSCAARIASQVRPQCRMRLQ